MSRRTKLIITALFLLLLSIPVAYVALTWTTPNPLRFHVIRYQGPLNPDALGKMDVRVENTGDLPVHLFPGFKFGKTPGGIPEGGIYPERPGFILISPRSSVSFPANVEYHTSQHPSSGEVFRMGYSWLSGTTYKVDEVRMWLKTHLPKPLSAMVPHVILANDITTLELPALKQAPSPAASTR
jgi:hypothetical protein